jgi:hypothetical protein
MKKHYIILIIIALTILGCGQKKQKINLKGIDFDIKIERFDKDFWAIKEKNYAEELPKLFEKYPEFAPVYFANIINFGDNIDEIAEILPDFFAREDVKKLYSDALQKFSDVRDLEKSLTNAFRRGKYFFPNLPIPKILMHVSGFNQSVVVAENLISISVDNYLGAKYPLYEKITYHYLAQNMRREKVASDYIFAWLSTEFSYFSEQDRLLDEMIYKGKILYITSLLMPDETEENLIGYTSEQWKWCKNYEKDMWQTLIENKYLFGNDFQLRKKMLEDAPFTQPFTQESPGRAGIFIGFRIVESYMRKNSEISPWELMQNPDAQSILEHSGYRP